MAAWTPTDDTTLLALHAEGLTLNQVSVRMGRAKSTVSKRAKGLNIAWAMRHTQAATEAKILDGKARRAALKIDLLEDAAKLRAQVWKPHKYIDHGGKDFARVEWTQKEPTPTDKLKLVQAATLAIDKAVKLDLHDKNDETQHAIGLLGAIAIAIETAAKELNEEAEPSPPTSNAQPPAATPPPQ